MIKFLKITKAIFILKLEDISVKFDDYLKSTTNVRKISDTIFTQRYDDCEI